MSRPAPTTLVFAVSLLLAALASIYPLPQPLKWYRPEWACLLIIFWVLYYPHRVGIGTAWLVGLALDIIEGDVWGAHALSLALVAYICQVAYRRLLSYSVSQQTLWVFVFVGIYQLFYNWLQSLDGVAAPVRLMLISNLISAALWPILLLCMARLGLRRR